MHADYEPEDNLPATAANGNASTALNPFAGAHDRKADVGAVATVAGGREMAEVKAMVQMARYFPRDRRASMNRILDDCTRVSLAERAEYAYKRGGEIVSGPSIRLAEVLANQWGNIQCGVRELEQNGPTSSVEAYAWDLETNTRISKVFHVKHERDTKSGKKTLTDGRDVYEHVANLAARRMRACILAVIPGDVVEAATKACQATLANKMGAPAERVEKMVASFATVGVTREMLTKRVGHKLESSTQAELLNLGRIFNSIRDGIGSAGDFFEGVPATQDDRAAELQEAITGGDKPAKPAKSAKPVERDPDAGEVLPDNL